MESVKMHADFENKQNASRKREAQENNNAMADQKRPKLAENTAGARADKEPRAAKVHQSPKKRLQVTAHVLKAGVGKGKGKDKALKEKFIYGNYSQYYGYRNKDKDFHDIRLDIFEKYKDLLRSKEVLDIGCNTGFITVEVAKRFQVKHITGIDIDRGLIAHANGNLFKLKKSSAYVLPHAFPRNVSFVHGNYVLRDDLLLEIEREQFDVILCLSITKWIQLNFGDAGLKQAFRRMFLQLRSGGRLILEAQPYDNYFRRKKMTETIFANYKAIQFFPKHFTEYLLSADGGFKTVELMGVPENCAAGFKRPIQIFLKE